KKLRFTGRKNNQKLYYRHTGYIGNMKIEKLKELFVKNPESLFKKVLRGMLPKNKWRDKLLKRVTFV
ncbi:MAG: 50S ribosomal protein L13, partial [Parcubacteria group bacterium GW2011_GWC1_45_9]